MSRTSDSQSKTKVHLRTSKKIDRYEKFFFPSRNSFGSSYFVEGGADHDDEQKQPQNETESLPPKLSSQGFFRNWFCTEAAAAAAASAVP